MRTAVCADVGMQSANQEPVEFFHARIDGRRRRCFFVRTSAFLLGTPKVLRGWRLWRTAPKHMRFESIERGRVGFVVQLVGICADMLPHPILEERFLFELRQFRFFAGASLRS